LRALLLDSLHVARARLHDKVCLKNDDDELFRHWQYTGKMRTNPIALMCHLSSLVLPRDGDL